MRVYLLHHVRDKNNDESIKLCGVFSSQTAAETVQKQLLEKPGFRDYPEGFDISEYEIDRICWVDGFGFDPDE